MNLSIKKTHIPAIIMMIASTISNANDSTPNKPENLINRYIQAIGGADALMEMQSFSRNGRITFYEKNIAKNSFCYRTDIIYPSKLREQIKNEKIEYDRGTDGNVYWLWNGNQYEFTEDEKLIDYMRNTAERANRDALWLKKEFANFGMSTIPSWAPNHSQCMQEINPKGTSKRTYCFDESTGLLNALGSTEEYRLESDWRSVGNVKLIRFN